MLQDPVQMSALRDSVPGPPGQIALCPNSTASSSSQSLSRKLVDLVPDSAVNMTMCLWLVT